MTDEQIAEIRRLIRRMEREALEWNDVAVARRVRFWRRMLREELARRATQSQNDEAA